VSCVKRLNRSTCRFERRLMWALRNHVLDGVQIPNGKGQFSAVFRVIQKQWQYAAAFAAKWITQSTITSCSRRYHSVCQASANSNPKNSEHRRCGLLAGKGVMGVHSAGEVWYLTIYDCLVLSMQLVNVHVGIKLPSGTEKTSRCFLGHDHLNWERFYVPPCIPSTWWTTVHQW